MPVHSELRHPRTSSSSAIGRSSCARALTCLLQFLLERIPVHPVVVALELVDELVDLVHVLARDDPERDRLAPAAELLPRVPVGIRGVRRFHGAGMRERLPFPLLPEDFPDHAASARTARR